MKIEKMLIAVSLLVVLIAVGIVVSMSLAEQKAEEETWPEFIRANGTHQLGHRMQMHVNTYMMPSSGHYSSAYPSGTAPSTGTMRLNFSFSTGGLFSRGYYGGQIDPVLPGWFFYLESSEDMWFFNGDVKSPEFEEIHVSVHGGTSSSGTKGLSLPFYRKAPPKFLDALPPAFVQDWEKKIGIVTQGELKVETKPEALFMRKPGTYPLGRGRECEISYSCLLGYTPEAGVSLDDSTTGAIRVHCRVAYNGVKNGPKANLVLLAPGWFLYYDGGDKIWTFSGNKENPEFRELQIQSNGAGIYSNKRSKPTLAFYERAPDAFLRALPPETLKEWQKKVGAAPLSPESGS